MKTLFLHVKEEYFFQIRSGEKKFEFRQKTLHWQHRLVGQKYDFVEIAWGYPRKEDDTRRVRFPWNGYLEKTIIHPHFGENPVDVYAIILAYNQK